MKVFIGWSGSRSQQLAQALRDWMPLVLHYAEPWLSEADISAGERWAQSMAKELEVSNFGIISVTRENVASPWILFEAGSLAKSLEESRVIPLLLDLEFSEISGPLAQFQAKKADRDGLSEVIQSVNKVAPEPVPEARAGQLFEALWPKLEEQLSSIPKQPAAAKPTRPQPEILEELVAGVRSLESRLRDVAGMVSEEIPRSRRRGLSRLHPFMLNEMGMMIGEGPGDPIALVIAASMFREDIPWLYELGMEAYRAVKAGKPEEAQSCLRRFLEAADLAAHGPYAERMGPDSRELLMMIRDLGHSFLQRGFPDEEPRTKARRRKPEGQE